MKKAAAAFKTILKNPIGFVRNLIAAGKQGLSQFVSNFVKHLKTALIGWLTGALEGAGIYIPQAMTLLEIGKFVLSVLGITWQKIRAKIVKVIGETAMKAIETGLDIVVALVRGGPAAAWEVIKEKLTNLKDMVIESIISFVKDKVVTAAVTKLLSLLSPVGAFIQAIIGIYNTIMFFVERMRQIAQVAAAVIDSISAIANGIIGAAANKVEQTMAGLLTLVISFLARIAGLGKVTDAVTNFIKKVQEKVDKAIDFAINWIVEKAKALLKGLFGKKDDRTDAQKQADLDKGVAEAEALIGPKMLPDQIKKRLPAIKSRYKMTTLELVVDSESATSETVHIHGEINPKKDGSQKPVLVLSPELQAIKDKLVLPKSKTYFDEKLLALGNAGALALFKSEDARTDKVGLRALRDSNNLGPNIEGSPTVATLSANVSVLGSVGFTGISGSYDSAAPSKLRLNAVTPTHAEGRCMTKLAAAMDAAAARGGSGSISVDKPPCGFCSGAFASMREQYSVALAARGP